MNAMRGGIVCVVIFLVDDENREEQDMVSARMLHSQV
jgi:hypothetical protein